MYRKYLEQENNNNISYPDLKEMYEITSDDEKKLAKLSIYQQAILHLLVEVPKGKVTTYGDLAKELSKRNSHWSPNASRAVGTTMKKNPCGPQIPCHRVIKSDGTIGNFKGGVEGATKEKINMLRKEGVTILNGKVNLKEYRHEFK